MFTKYLDSMYLVKLKRLDRLSVQMMKFADEKTTTYILISTTVLMLLISSISPMIAFFIMVSGYGYLFIVYTTDMYLKKRALYKYLKRR